MIMLPAEIPCSRPAKQIKRVRNFQQLYKSFFSVSVAKRKRTLVGGYRLYNTKDLITPQTGWIARNLTQEQHVKERNDNIFIAEKQYLISTGHAERKSLSHGFTLYAMINQQ